MSKRPKATCVKSTLHRSIEDKIFKIRDRRVMLDKDLAVLYEIPNKALNQAVRRNPERFPDDFMFRLTHEEASILKSQFVTSRWGGIRKLPHAFTEHGILMLSSVLKSNKAAQVNIGIMRAYVRMRQLANTHEDLRRKIKEMERKYASKFKIVFDALTELLKPPINPNKRPIGFHAEPIEPAASSRIKSRGRRR